MTFFGISIAWGFYRYGYSLLAPGTFANEILETLPIGVAMLRIDGRIRSANGDHGPPARNAPRKRSSTFRSATCSSGTSWT